MAAVRILVACYRFTTNKTIRQCTRIMPWPVAIAVAFVHGKAMCDSCQVGMPPHIPLLAADTRSIKFDAQKQSIIAVPITPPLELLIQIPQHLVNGQRKYCYLTVAGDFTPLARQIRQAPSSDTMHGPTGVRGVHAVPNSLHSFG